MKVLILGSTGFAGKNIADCLSAGFTPIQTTRKTGHKPAGAEIYFDFFNKDSWNNIISVSPDIIINAAAYGVIKLETDADIMYKTNYFLTADLYEYLRDRGCTPYWLQLGTAFEYDLSISDIDEESPCLPRTHYGISKLMMSNYLISKGEAGRFCILRPFGMFGKYEDESKFFPYLINAQKKNIAIDLSPGTQQRDYIYVSDLGNFINHLLIRDQWKNLPPVLNIGRGEAMSFLDYASVLQTLLPSFNPDLWRWGKIGFRTGESPLFYSSSKKAMQYGFMNTRLEESFTETIKYYFSSQ